MPHLRIHSSLVPGQALEESEEMAVHPGLLGLERDASAIAKQQNTPFLLSLRDSREFSSLHSFGLFRVPHIGKGRDWYIC